MTTFSHFLDHVQLCQDRTLNTGNLQTAQWSWSGSHALGDDGRTFSPDFPPFMSLHTKHKESGVKKMAEARTLYKRKTYLKAHTPPPKATVWYKRTPKMKGNPMGPENVSG